MRPDAHLVFRRYLDAVGLNGQASAAAAGLHATEWYALSVIDLAGRLTSGELADRTGLTTGATTRLIDRLERRGHVRRVSDPTDRRKVIIEPTGQDSPDIEEIVGSARRLLAKVFDRYSQEQLDTLFDYFAHATPALQQATEEIRARTAGRR
jgi:DNA-binding MarR family transcriptional regulator